MNVSFEQWSEPFKKAQESFQALGELNVKTMERFTYLKPDDLANLKNPGEFWEKQMSIAVENGHNALNYMQKSFLIMEKAMLSLAPESKNITEIKK